MKSLRGNEKDLLLRIAQDDKIAFTLIYKQYFHHIYLLMLKYTNRPTDAEDIVQQVFVNMWDKRHLLAEIERFDKWIFTLAVNEFRMRFRKARNSEQYRQYLKETFQEEHGSPEDLLIIKQKEHLLRKALAQLSPKQREVFLLSREKGLTYTEISKELGLQQSTVKEHISRALKAVKKFVSEHKDEFLFIFF